MRSGANVCKSCRSRQGLSNDYVLAKIRFDTAENEPLKVCQKLEQSWRNVRKNGGESTADLFRDYGFVEPQPQRWLFDAGGRHWAFELREGKVFFPNGAREHRPLRAPLCFSFSCFASNIFLIFGKLWEARSRLYRRQIVQVTLVKTKT